MITFLAIVIPLVKIEKLHIQAATLRVYSTRCALLRELPYQYFKHLLRVFDDWRNENHQRQSSPSSTFIGCLDRFKWIQ